MKKLFKKPSFWVILLTVIGLIIARIFQVRKNLKKNAIASGADLSAGAITKAFFTQPIMSMSVPDKTNDIDPVQATPKAVVANIAPNPLSIFSTEKLFDLDRQSTN